MNGMYEALLRGFREAFTDAGEPMLVRAPGRVNLIGEHTDYNGLPVLPVAIERDIAIACAPRNDGLFVARNLDPRHEPRTFPIDEAAGAFEQGDWGNYLRAAVRGLIDDGLLTTGMRGGVTAFIAGTVPEAAGLSSSSALVVAAAIAVLHCAGVGYDPLRLAEALARSERYAGLEGGGMDQAICLLAQSGHALKIDFFPLRVRPVALPDGYSFVVCNSLVRAAKSGDSRAAYNTRVAECRLAALLLAREIPRQAPLKPVRLSELCSSNAEEDTESLLARAAALLGDTQWPLARVAAATGRETEEIVEICSKAKDGSTVSEPPGGFRLLPRIRHVLTEAQRVERAVHALERGDMQRFGALMDASHASCARDFEVSTPELDALVELARRNGALGARLTGAGFGGCTVNLVRDDRVQGFLDAMERDYYEAYIHAHDRGRFVPSSGHGEALFPCHAGSPAQRIPI